MIKAAHKHSLNNRGEILLSQECGCFHCTNIFVTDLIYEWIDEGDTAVCPHCGVDSVLGDKAGFPLNEDFLATMGHYWFGGDQENL